MAEKVGNFFKAVFYDDSREFLSRTALMNFVFFMLTVLTILASIVLLILAIVNEWEVKATGFITAFYVFLGGVTGGGFLQYSFTKKLNVNKASSKDQSVSNA